MTTQSEQIGVELTELVFILEDNLETGMHLVLTKRQLRILIGLIKEKLRENH